MEKSNRVNEKYIYNKPECILIRRVFMAFVLYFLCGAFVCHYDVKELINKNELIMYENSSMFINLIAGYLLTAGFSALEKFFSWLKDRVYDSKKIEYTVEDSYKSMAPCVDSDKYFLYQKIENEVIKTIDEFIPDKKENTFILLPSTPGMGKSVFLQKLKQTLCDKNLSYSYFCGYFDCMQQQNLQSNIIILDDFENIFWCSNDVRKLKELFCDVFDGDKHKLVLIAFASESLANVIQLFESINGKKELLLWSYDEDDIKEIECRMLNSIGLSVWDMGKSNEYVESSKLNLINKLLCDLRNGISISMIEISTIAKMIVKESCVTIERWNVDIKKNNYSYRDYLVGKYLYDIILKSENVIMSSVILYSLAKTSSLKEKLSYKTLQELYYFDNETLAKIIKYLEGNGLIKNNLLGCSRERHVVLGSKFWEIKIPSIAKNILDSSVIYNIDTYFEMKNRFKINITSNNYEIYQEGINWIRKTLCFLLLFSVVANVRNYSNCQKLDEYVFFAFLNLLMGLTVMYNYNYIYHFLLPCKKIFKYNMSISAVLLCGLYWYSDFWYLFWGFGMLVQIISLIIIGRKTFIKDILVFSMIGILVSGIGYSITCLFTYLKMNGLEYFIPLLKLGSVVVVCAIMCGALVRHIILSYLLSSIMKVRNLDLINNR